MRRVIFAPRDPVDRLIYKIRVWRSDHAGETRRKKEKRLIKAARDIRRVCLRGGGGCELCIFERRYGSCPFLGLPYKWESFRGGYNSGE